MKKHVPGYFLLLLFIWPIYTEAQAFSMGKKCEIMLEEANSLINSEAYIEALAKLDEFCGNCKNKEAKELGAVHKAEVYNALGEHQRAIKEANIALEITKEESLSAHFQKGIALEKLGDMGGSKQAFNTVSQLIETSENPREKASKYALMANIYNRQLNLRDSAMMYLDKAMAQDPDNTSFEILKGDMYLYHKEYKEAYAAYDQALKNGHNSLEVFKCRSNTGLRWLENKYGTSTAMELRDLMTEDDKRQVCSDIKKALNLGYKSLNMDMFSTLICN
ncbi:tetratricopeptide repeat protein [Echinicola sediminis]